MQVVVYIFGFLIIVGLSALLVWNVYGLVKAILNRRKQKKDDKDIDLKK